MLIIWDFDGVISDTEHLWINIWQEILNKNYNLNWDFNKANEVLGGVALKTKVDRLSKINPEIEVNENLLNKVKENEARALAHGITLVDGVEDIFKLKEFTHCIATGGSVEKTDKKIEVLNLRKYFPEKHVFSADHVRYGKPEPDLFLFAAEQMGVAPKESIVIEDSLAGLTAGMRAKMQTIAFIGCTMNNSEHYRQQVLNIGIRDVFTNMAEVKDFLIRNYLTTTINDG